MPTHRFWVHCDSSQNHLLIRCFSLAVSLRNHLSRGHSTPKIVTISRRVPEARCSPMLNTIQLFQYSRALGDIFTPNAVYDSNVEVVIGYTHSRIIKLLGGRGTDAISGVAEPGDAAGHDEGGGGRAEDSGGRGYAVERGVDRSVVGIVAPRAPDRRLVQCDEQRDDAVLAVDAERQPADFLAGAGEWRVEGLTT